MQAFIRLTSEANRETVATGSLATAVISENGDLYLCGDVSVFGLKDKAPANRLTVVALEEAVYQVNIGVKHIVCLAESGRVWVCGHNESGALGLPAVELATQFTLLELPEPMRQISAGGDQTFLLNDRGQLWAFGLNIGGVLGLGGLVVAVRTPTRVPISEAVVQVYTSTMTSAVITESGQLWGCGYTTGPTYSSCFTLIPTPERVVQVAVDDVLILILTDRGRVWYQGGMHGDYLNLPEPFVRVTATAEKVVYVAAGHGSRALITASGRLWVGGSNADKKLGVRTVDRQRAAFNQASLTEPVRTISFGRQHSVALAESGRLWVAGSNRSGQLGLLSDATRPYFTETYLITGSD